MPRDAAALFYESQRLPLRRVAIALLVPPSVLSLLLLWQVVLGHHWKGQSLSNGDVIFWTIFLWLLYLRLMTVRLITRVRGGKLKIQLRGVWRSRRISLSDIRSVEIIALDPVRDYGGYGIRSISGGKAAGSKAWLANNTRGVSLQLADGKTVIIGSQRPEELADFLANVS
jgi:hypothetical protein